MEHLNLRYIIQRILDQLYLKPFAIKYSMEIFMPWKAHIKIELRVFLVHLQTIGFIKFDMRFFMA